MLAEYTEVHVVQLLRPIDDYDGWLVNRRPPRIGDSGYIVGILRAPNLPIRYVVESSASDGTDIWLSESDADELELVLR
jgi:hypothetical protein